MKAIIVLLAVLACYMEGCFLFQGHLYRDNMSVVLLNNQPSYQEVGENATPGKTLGNLDRRAGDTINTIGIFKGVFAGYSSYLILIDTQEVYIHRSDVLTPDDQLYLRLGSTFSLNHSEDQEAWKRAWDYIKNHTNTPIEIVKDNLIKTKSVNDSAAVNYLVTRSIRRNRVEYEIICRSLLPRFNAENEAHQMAFYMASGRMYVRED